MSLSSRALRELRGELKALERRRNEIDSRIKGIELVLAAEQADYGGVRRGDADESSQSAAHAASNGGSLKANVLEILRRAAAGSDASDITRRLNEKGFRVGGDTTLRQRVVHELARLRRAGILQKRGTKRYVVARRAASSVRGRATRGRGLESTGSKRMADTRVSVPSSTDVSRTDHTRDDS